MQVSFDGIGYRSLALEQRLSSCHCIRAWHRSWGTTARNMSCCSPVRAASYCADTKVAAISAQYSWLRSWPACCARSACLRTKVRASSEGTDRPQQKVHPLAGTWVQKNCEAGCPHRMDGQCISWYMSPSSGTSRSMWVGGTARFSSGRAKDSSPCCSMKFARSPIWVTSRASRISCRGPLRDPREWWIHIMVLGDRTSIGAIPAGMGNCVLRLK